MSAVSSMNILAFSAFSHDSAACIVVDGVLTAAVQEERFTRVRHDMSFPVQAISYCLEMAECMLQTLDLIVFYGHAAHQEQAFAGLIALDADQSGWSPQLLHVDVHLGHVASAFFPSPFQDAAILTLDGAGHGISTSFAIGAANSITTLQTLQSPHSLGLLYSAMTDYLGFKANSGEYKMMGLAPYGKPRFANQIREHLIAFSDDGLFRLNPVYFAEAGDGDVFASLDRLATLFDGARRVPESLLTQREMDLAASIQCVTEDAVIHLARHLAVTSGQRNVCLAGGVALNCVANGKLYRQKLFERIWIQPAAGQAGGTVGAAFFALHEQLQKPRHVVADRDAMQGAYLGPAFEQHEIEARLSAVGGVFEVMPDEQLADVIAYALTQEKAIGWHQGRMEFGPRALGGRSILGDPRSPRMQKMLNLKVKYRESFRPFAPSVLAEDVSDWFDIDTDSPYMLMVANVAQTQRVDDIASHDVSGIAQLGLVRSTIPAVTHVDFSARIQTVHANTNPKFHALLQRFKALTGCPVLVNTSFNVRGEPIVLTPEDAFYCFMGTDIDMLVVGNCVLCKEQQTPELMRSYQDAYPLD